MSTAGEISNSRDYRSGEKLPRDGQDWYIEPDWAVDLLLEAEGFTGTVWDPCAGSGTIPKRCLEHGMHNVYGSDILNRGYWPPLRKLDFTGPLPLQTPVSWGPFDNIIMNPPYRQAEVFIRRARNIARHKVAVLVQAKFPYSQWRNKLFTKYPPARIYFLSNRPSMPPGTLLQAGVIKAKGGKVDYCWMVWSNDRPNGPTTAHWLLRPKYQGGAHA